jgi:hypothetical protein
MGRSTKKIFLEKIKTMKYNEMISKLKIFMKNNDLEHFQNV